MEVRREDQEKINRFSSLHQKETALEEELRARIVRTWWGSVSTSFY
jgi:prefoldin subunit 4